MDNGLIFPYPPALKVTENKRYCVLTEMYVEATVEVVIVHKGFGCEGLVTDGCVRDLPDIAPGFQMLAASVLPSHAFVHVVDFSRPVEVCGMRVVDGDIIHADQHGAVVIPAEALNDLKSAAEQIIKREQVIIRAAQKPGFNIDELRAAQGAAAEIH